MQDEEEQYEILNEPNKKFEVRAVNDLENCKTLEQQLLAKGYDGYVYALRNVDPEKNYEVYNCFKLIDGPFIKMPQITKVN